MPILLSINQASSESDRFNANQSFDPKCKQNFLANMIQKENQNSTRVKSKHSKVSKRCMIFLKNRIINPRNTHTQIYMPSIQSSSECSLFKFDKIFICNFIEKPRYRLFFKKKRNKITVLNNNHLEKMLD